MLAITRASLLGSTNRMRFFRDSDFGNVDLLDVKYIESRPTYEGVEDFSVLTTKSTDWSYETEARLLRMLGDDEASIGNDEAGLPIHLIDIPREAILKVIVGARAGALAGNVNAALRSHKMDWVKARKAALSETSFALDLT